MRKRTPVALLGLLVGVLLCLASAVHSKADESADDLFERYNDSLPERDAEAVEDTMHLFDGKGFRVAEDTTIWLEGGVVKVERDGMIYAAEQTVDEWLRPEFTATLPQSTMQVTFDVYFEENTFIIWTNETNDSGENPFRWWGQVPSPEQPIIIDQGQHCRCTSSDPAAGVCTPQMCNKVPPPACSAGLGTCRWMMTVPADDGCATISAVPMASLIMGIGFVALKRRTRRKK